MPGPFDLAFDDLPDVIPIFPLAGVLLLPGGTLPLNIFERRYLNMTADCLKTDHRLIGMIQPTGEDDAETAARPGRTGPRLYPLGCAGRLVSFAETPDGRYLINLAGVARFRIAEELPLERGYRRIRPDFSPYEADLDPAAPMGLDRDRLTGVLGQYFTAQNIQPNWETIEKMGDRDLVTFLAMGCPFDPSEKQALLEAKGPDECGEVLLALLEMAARPEAGGESTRH